MIARILNSIKRDPVIWLTGLASLALIITMNVHYTPLFASLTSGHTLPDSDINVTPESLFAMRELLGGNPDAASLLFNMHLYPDMALPALLGLFFFLLILRLVPGTILYGRPAEKLLPILLALPIAYAFCDYSENVVSMLIFPPATPSATMVASLVEPLYWATRLKFVFSVICAILVVRLAVGRFLARDRHIER